MYWSVAVVAIVPSQIVFSEEETIADDVVEDDGVTPMRILCENFDYVKSSSPSEDVVVNDVHLVAVAADVNVIAVIVKRAIRRLVLYLLSFFGFSQINPTRVTR